MTGALTYLAVCSIRNGIAVRLRRLRQPRYLLVGLALLLYVANTIFTRSQHAWAIPSNYERWAVIGGTVFGFGIMMLMWVMSASGALRFTSAEVAFLFPAPITRRQLLGYKIVRLLVACCGSAVFFTIVIGPVRPLAALMFAGKAGLISAVLGLHEAGVSLYRTNRQAMGGLSARRQLPLLLAAVVVAALAAWIMARFAFASGGELWRLSAVVVLLLAVNVVWVLGSDAAFEEEAAINAEKVRGAVAAAEKGHARPISKRSTPFRLAPTGRPETAILWKNWLLFGRTPRLLIVALSLSGLLIGGGFLAASIRSPEPGVIPLLLLVIAVFAVVLGPIMARWDLRHDLANLVVLKTWPVSGAAIFRGELLAPALALSLGAVIPITLAGLTAPAFLLDGAASATGRFSFIVSATLVACATIVAELVIQNGVAVAFPAWVRITPSVGTGGFEAMGQMMVLMYGGLLALLIASLVPAGAAAAVVFTIGGTLIPAAVFSTLLLIESFAATEILGRILDRTDIQDVEVSE